MAQALRIPVVGVPTLDLIAYPLRHTQPARRRGGRRPPARGVLRRVPTGAGRRAARSPTTRSAHPTALAAELAARGEELLLAGDGALRYATSSRRSTGSSWPGPGAAAPSAAALVELATARVEREEFSPPASVHPLYLRRSDAEIEWDRGEGGSGEP